MTWCCWPIIFSPNSTPATARQKLQRHRAQTLREYHWPGNVRELKNAIERAFIICEQELELQPMNIHAPGNARTASERQRGRHSACRSAPRSRRPSAG